MVFRFTLLFVASLNFTFTSVFSQDEDEYLLWGKISNRPEYTGTIVNQSDLDTDNNLYVVGTFYKGFPLEQDPSQISSVLQLFIHKYDSNGNLLWSREYGTEAYPSYAGDIRVDKNGDIIFTGYLRDLGGSVFGQPNEGFFISKLDKHGSLIWVKPLTRTNLFTWGERVGVFGKQSKMEIDKDNSIVVYSNGNPLGSPGDFFSGLYISRYSSEGNLIHQYQITHDDNFNTPGLGGLAIDNDGNLIITGYYNFGLKIGGIILGHTSDAVRLFLAKFTMTGDLLWAKTTDGLSAGSDVDVDEIGNIYFTGVAPGHATFGDGKQLNPSDYDPAFVAKLNSNGQIIWSKSLVARPISLKWTSLGNLYITGTCADGLSFDDHKVNRPGLEESFVLKINQDTSIGGAIVSDGAPIDYNFKIAHQSHIDEAGNIYTIGNFNKLIVFGCDTLLSGGDEMFITKYTEVPPVYNIFIDGPKTLCDGSPLKLSATPIPEPVKYFWMLPTGATATNASANQVNATVDYSSNGGEILVEIKKGCYRYQGREPYKINILLKPKPVLVKGQQLFCKEETTRFNCTVSTDASFYYWELPSGITPVQNKLITTEPFIDVIVFEEFNEGFVAVSARNECFASESSERLPIRALKKPSPISFIDVPNEFCNRGQVEYFNVKESEYATEYIWEIPSVMNEAGVVSTNTGNIKLTLKNTGTGKLSVYAKNDCHSTEKITLPIKLVNALDVPMLFKSECDFELTTDGEKNVIWYKDGLQFAQGISDLAITDEGDYFVTVTNSCGTVSSVTIEANPLFDDRIFVPDVITPNNDGKNDFFELSHDTDELKLEVFNRWGKSVYRNDNYKNNWNGSDLDSGVYYILLTHSCLKNQYNGWLHIVR